MLHPPGAAGDSGSADPSGLSFHMLSPLPDQRRDSHTEFDFPVNIPVPSEFADLSRKNSMQEGNFANEKCTISLEGIEVRIQSSTDNLVDVCEDEPYMFEEKPIEERRESLPSLLDKSFTIDEDVEHSETKSETDDRDQLEDSGSGAGDSDEHEELREDGKEKTETQDSDETDDTTLRETRAGDGQEGEVGEDNSSPEADTSALEEAPKQGEEEEDQTTTHKEEDEEEAVSFKEKEQETTPMKEDALTRQEEEEEEGTVEVVLTKPEEEVETVSTGDEEQEIVLRREEPMGEDAPAKPSIPDVPLAKEEIPDSLEEEAEVVGEGVDALPPMERIVEGAEAVTEDEMDEEEKGKDYEYIFHVDSTVLKYVMHELYKKYIILNIFYHVDIKYNVIPANWLELK